MPIDTTHSLVKFCGVDTAHKILKTKSLRWSAPDLFNDPFELDSETPLSFDPTSLLDAVMQTATGMIFSPSNPVGNTPLINAIRRWREEERFHSSEEAQGVLKELLGKMVDQQLQILDEVMTDWRKFARTLRICSFCEKANNVSAWQRYSNEHRGAALEFMVDPYATLKEAHRVVYQDKPPEITTIKEQLDTIIHNKSFEAPKHFQDKFTTKTKASEQDKEWRCIMTAEDTFNKSDGSFTDTKLQANDLKTIYFGINMPIKHKKVLLELARENFPQAKVYETKVRPGSYDLQFDQVKK